MVSKASPIVIKNDELEQELLDETSTGVGQSVNNSDQTTNGSMTDTEYNSMVSALDTLESDISALQARVDNAENQAGSSYASAIISGVDFNLKNYCMGRAITQIQFDYQRLWGLGDNDGSISPGSGDYLQRIANTVSLRLLNPVNYKEMGNFYFPSCSFMDSYMLTAKYTFETEAGQGPRPIWPDVKARCNAKISAGNYIVVSYYTPSNVSDYKLGTDVLVPAPTMGVCVFEIVEGSNMLTLVSDTNNRDDDYSLYEGSNTGCFTAQEFFDINSVILENGTVVFENRTQCLVVKHDQNDGTISLESKVLDQVTQNADASPANMKILRLESDPVNDPNFFALYGPADAADATDLLYKEYSTVDSTNMAYEYFVPLPQVKLNVADFSYAQYCSLQSMRVCGRYIIMAQGLRSDANYQSTDPDDATLKVLIIDRDTPSTYTFDLDNSSNGRGSPLAVAPTFISSVFITDEGDLFLAVTYEAIRSNVAGDIDEPARPGTSNGNNEGYYRIYRIPDLDNSTSVDGRIYEFSYQQTRAIDRDDTSLSGIGWRVYDHMSVNKFNLAPDVGSVGGQFRSASNILPVGFLDMGDEIHLPLRGGGIFFGAGEYVGIIKIGKLSDNSHAVNNPYIGFPTSIDERRFNIIAEKITDTAGTIGLKDPGYSRINAIEVSKI